MKFITQNEKDRQAIEYYQQWGYGECGCPLGRRNGECGCQSRRRYYQQLLEQKANIGNILGGIGIVVGLLAVVGVMVYFVVVKKKKNDSPHKFYSEEEAIAMHGEDILNDGNDFFIPPSESDYSVMSGDDFFSV